MRKIIAAALAALAWMMLGITPASASTYCYGKECADLDPASTSTAVSSTSAGLPTATLPGGATQRTVSPGPPTLSRRPASHTLVSRSGTPVSRVRDRWASPTVSSVVAGGPPWSRAKSLPRPMSNWSRRLRPSTEPGALPRLAPKA